jgi:hypothetical protein
VLYARAKGDFDRRLTLQFRGSVVTSDAGPLAYRELGDALGLTALAGEMLADARTGRSTRHSLRGWGDHWILKNNPMQSNRTHPILSDASVVLEDRTQINIGAGGAAAFSQLRFNDQKPGRRIAERLRNPSCRSSGPSERISRDTVIRRRQFEDAFARFLPPEPNIRTLKRGGGEKT